MPVADDAGGQPWVGVREAATKALLAGLVPCAVILLLTWMICGLTTPLAEGSPWPAVLRWAVGIGVLFALVRYWLLRVRPLGPTQVGRQPSAESHADSLVAGLHKLSELFARSKDIPDHVKSDEDKRRWCEIRELEIDLGENFLLVVGFISLWLMLGLLGNVVWAWGYAGGTPSYFWMALGSNGLASGAAALVGGLLGFLFGIPRTTVVTSNAPGARANTNLEQVSDWLTTLLIGATLTQLVNIPQGLWSIAGALASLPPPPGAPAAILSHQAVLVSTIVYHFIVGFLGLFLVTRVNFTYIFGHDALDDDQSASAAAPDPIGLSQVDAQVRAALASRSETDLDQALADAEVAARAVRTSDVDREFQSLLARAYGRRYQQKLAAHAPDDDLAGISGRALAAVTLAVKGADIRSPAVQALRSHLDAAASVPPLAEKDLVGFKDDKRFQDLLGLAATPPAPAPASGPAPIAPLTQTLSDALMSPTAETLDAALKEALSGPEQARSDPEVQALLARVQGRLYRILKQGNSTDSALEALLRGARDAVGKAAASPVQKTALQAELLAGKDLGEIAADPAIAAALG